MRSSLPPLLLALASVTAARADSSPPAPSPARGAAKTNVRSVSVVEVPRPPARRCSQPDGLWETTATGHPTGRRLTTKQLLLVSIANANDRYWLTALTPGGREPKAILCLGSDERAANSWGSSPGEGSITFELDRATADRVAAALHLERLDRRPLGAGLVWRFVVQAHAAAGQHVPIAWEVENRGAETVFFDVGGAYRGSGRDNRFAIAITRDGKPVADVGSSMNFGGLGTRLQVKPGGKQRVEESLERWAALDTPGRYELAPSFSTELHAAASDGAYRNDQAWDIQPGATAEIAIDPIVR